MLIPAVVFFLVFSYFPMVGIIIAFKSYDYAGGIFGSQWVGFENFEFLFIGGRIFTVIRNTVLYNIAFIVINNTLQIAVAIALSEIASRLFKKFSQAFLFLPFFMSWVIVGTFVYSLFNYEVGLFNGILRSLGHERINFYGIPVLWVFVILFFGVWKSLGYGSVLYLAAISSIDPELYEAADIDGASALQKIFRITIPSVKRVIIILVLLSIGNIFRGDFSMYFQIVGNNSVTFHLTDVIDTFVTRSLVQTREFGMTSAAGLIQSVLCFIIITIVNGWVRRTHPDYALY